MGLGKTIQVLALIVATLGDIKQRTLQQRTKFDKEEDKSNCRHSTLIIVPPALLSQWISEIKKAAPWLVVDALINGSWGHLERVQQPINSNQEQADIVMTTYQALEDNYLSCTKKKKKKHARNTKNSNNQFFMSQNDIADKIVIADCSWGRIILDEMQVIRSWTTRLSKLGKAVVSNRVFSISFITELTHFMT
jgi:SNF2 family DNA or RNA helicase